jgi:hypothetical protein
MSTLRELRDDQIQGPFETVAQLSRGAKPILEAHGVRFLERTEHDEPGPIHTAAVELEDGSQFLVVEHVAHPDQFIELRAQTERGSAHELTDQFVQAVDLPKREVTWVLDA